MSEQNPSSGKRPTLRTVAEMAGLAVATVSRALANDPKIAAATRARVAVVAEQVGYVPDRAAQRLRTGKTRVISLILDPHEEILGFGNAMLVGLTRALKGSDYNLVVTPHFSESDGMTPVRHIVRNNLADGVLFSRTTARDPRVEFLLDAKLPFVCHGRTEFARPHGSVDFDNHGFAQTAATRLLDRGCSRLCLIQPPERFMFHHHLRDGIAAAQGRHNVPVVFPQDITLDSSMEQIEKWAQTFAIDGVVGFICPGEASFLALRAGLRKQGLSHGRDYHAVVKASSGILAQIDPDTDQIIEDIQEAGNLMGQSILSQLRTPDAPPPAFLQPAIAAF